MSNHILEGYKCEKCGSPVYVIDQGFTDDYRCRKPHCYVAYDCYEIPYWCVRQDDEVYTYGERRTDIKNDS
jgi:hypothetical protein